MRWPAKLQMLLRSLFRHRQIEAELDEEMRDHLEQEIQSNIRAGMSAEEAKFAAQCLVGSVSLYKEECRDARGISLVESFARDLRYGIRMLRRTPLFTAAAILTLALGIGANTTVFTFVENILLRSFPARDPQQLVRIRLSFCPLHRQELRGRRLSLVLCYLPSKQQTCCGKPCSTSTQT